MSRLHLSAPIRRGLGDCLRPGGLAVTRRMLELVQLPPDPAVLDAGCGTGATVAFLRGRGLRNVFGIDLDASLLTASGCCPTCLTQGDLACLPVSGRCLDLVVCECAWNLADRCRVLAEFARVSKPGAYLGLSDIYNRSPSGTGDRTAWPIASCLSMATGLDTVVSEVTGAGFSIEAVEDHSALLTRTAAEFVFAHGSLHGFWQAVTGDAGLADRACAAAADSRPGLFLVIARRKECS